ncbi:MAG: DnaJ domain-containing protein [Candidatus Eisenbacteria bacterium]|nr:DnaJ domain-containing protein [Candidatus Eisenbacteria bacterium]
MGSAMKCWNCQNALEEVLVCERCGVPQTVGFMSPFEVLGIPPNLSWEEEKLRRTYERMALRCHPDLFRAHNDDRVLQAARSAMRGLNDAYRTLSDPVSRLRYVLAASGQTQEIPRAVPEGLQAKAQIIGRVLEAIEQARSEGDAEAWEAQQDHLASLQVQAEKARDRSHATLLALMLEWDQAVSQNDGGWPEMPPGWNERAMSWLGERRYLDVLEARMAAGRQWPAEAPAGEVSGG